MCKLSITLFFYFFGLIQAPNTEKPATFYSLQRTAEEKAVESLVEIEPSLALPIVLYKQYTLFKPQPPEKLVNLVVEDGRIVGGTQFEGAYPGQQIFYCPDVNSSKKCLVRTDFPTGEPLQCAEEPLAILSEVQDSGNDVKCGMNKVGTLYHFIFEFCERFDLDYNPVEPILIYEFCFDADERKILYTRHPIFFGSLPRTKALKRESELKYPMASIDEFIPYNYESLEYALKEESVPISEQKSVYKTQKLVPSEDLVFASWRKPTFQYLNLELQHENLVQLWNEIDRIIVNYAEVVLTNERTWTLVRTGVFDLPSTPLRDDGQKSDVWARIIFCLKDGFWDGLLHAAVVLMDNFVDTTITTPTPASLARENEMKEYCEQDSCDDDLLDKFRNVGGRLRCCSLTTKMREMFDFMDDPVNEEMLHIPGLNKIIEKKP